MTTIQHPLEWEEPCGHEKILGGNPAWVGKCRLGSPLSPTFIVLPLCTGWITNDDKLAAYIAEHEQCVDHHQVLQTALDLREAEAQLAAMREVVEAAGEVRPMFTRMGPETFVRVQKTDDKLGTLNPSDELAVDRLLAALAHLDEGSE